MNIADEVQLVTFRLGGHEFAFNVFEVERILRYEEPNPLPKAPDYLVGMLKHGDEVIPVVDLRERLELPGSIDEGTRIAIVQWDDGKIGLVVDAVLEVLKASAESVAAPPAIVKGLAADCISGILTLGERTVILLAVAKLLATDQRVALRSLMAEIRNE
jgi:purine-binding chemotaxis protein CheW